MILSLAGPGWFDRKTNGLVVSAGPMSFSPEGGGAELRADVDPVVDTLGEGAGGGGDRIFGRDFGVLRCDPGGWSCFKRFIELSAKQLVGVDALRLSGVCTSVSIIRVSTSHRSRTKILACPNPIRLRDKLRRRVAILQRFRVRYRLELRVQWCEMSGDKKACCQGRL